MATFKEITNLEEKELLWEAGLLWYRDSSGYVSWTHTIECLSPTEFLIEWPKDDQTAYIRVETEEA